MLGEGGEVAVVRGADVPGGYGVYLAVLGGVAYAERVEELVEADGHYTTVWQADKFTSFIGEGFVSWEAPVGIEGQAGEGGTQSQNCREVQRWDAIDVEVGKLGAVVLEEGFNVGQFVAEVDEVEGETTEARELPLDGFFDKVCEEPAQGQLLKLW